MHERIVPKDKDIKIKMTPMIWAVILVAGLLSGVGNYWLHHDVVSGIQVTMIVGLLAYMSMVDIQLHMAPDWISVCIFLWALPSAAIAIVNHEYAKAISMGVGLLVCFVPLILAAMFSKGGIGGADIKMMMALGFYLGASKAFLALLAGLVLAVVFNGIRILTKRANKEDKFALIPYLALGSLYFLIV